MARYLIILLLAGCTNFTGDNFAGSGWKIADARYCKTYALSQGYTSFGGLAGAFDYAQKQQSAFDLCMMDRGYWPNP